MNRKILSVGFDFGASFFGSGKGAELIHNAWNLHKMLPQSIFVKLKNKYPNIYDKSMIQERESLVSKINKWVFKETIDSPHHMIIGGDHSLALGSVLSSINKINSVKEQKNSNMAVVWCDAHPDINTFDSSLTKNFHGMPLGFATGLDNKKKMWEWLNECNKLDFKDLYYVGIRDIDKYEQEIIDKYNIKVTNCHKELQKYLEKYENIHFSLDVDSLDPSVISSTGTPVENGLSLAELYNIIDVVKKKNMIGIDIVEFNPYLSKDQNHKERELKKIIKIIREIIE